MSAKIVKRLLTCLLVLVSAGRLSANDVRVTNVVVNTDRTINFDISWQNSWRNTGVANTTNNYDGVWIFVKYRACSLRNTNTAWSHMWMNAAGHSAPGASIDVATSVVGGTPRGMGLHMYRTANQTTAAAFTATGCELAADAAMGATFDPNATNYDVRVFAIEMVWIPTASFRVGDGVALDGISPGYGSFYTVGTGTDDPYFLSSEGAITVGTADGNLNSNSTVSPSHTDFAGNTYALTAGPISADYPKGYQGFWCMKYEITQGQYSEFLNTLTREQQRNRAPGLAAVAATAVSVSGTWTYIMHPTAASTVQFRNSIRCDATLPSQLPVTTFCDFNGDGVQGADGDGAAIACNFLSRADLLAWLDWSALRPMTDLQFEKICRGPATAATAPPTVPGETGWGLNGNTATNYSLITGFQLPGSSNETPVVSGTASGSGVVIAGLSYSTLNGPGRVGSTHTAATSRVQAGSSYYGVSDMIGNVAEYVVSCRATGRNLTRDHNGDGTLVTSGNTVGNADVTGWDAVSNTTNNWMFPKGGSWVTGGHAQHPTITLFTSERYFHTSPAGVVSTGYIAAPAGGFQVTPSLSVTPSAAPNSNTHPAWCGGRGVR